MSRKQCLNVPSATYSGKEQSPLRFGLSAEGYPVSTILEGNDKLMWKVEVKNNKKVWIRNSICNKITHEEPVITDSVDIKIPEDNIEIIEPNNTAATKKEATDYSLFLSYRLKELKNENKDSVINNKNLYNTVIQEWKKLKSDSPNELKNLIEKIKQENTEKKVVIKKKETKKPKASSKKDVKEEVSKEEISKEEVEEVTKEEVTKEEKVRKPRTKTVKKK